MEDMIATLEAQLNRPEIVLVFLIVFITLLLNYLARRVLRQIEKRAEETKNLWDDALAKSARRPAAWLIWVLGISWAAEILAIGSGSLLEELISPTRFVLIVAVIAYFLSRFVIEAEKASVANGADVTTARALSKLIRVSIFITAGLTVLQTLGVSISGVLAFGGIGGIAVGFAAQDLLSNFFGGLTIYMDRPFAVGEWIRSPDREIEGTVEEIGWRLTKIRTFDQRPLYVPNSVFTKIALENPSRMRNRRIFETIGIRYDDASKMKVIVDDVRAMLAAHPDIDHERTLIVNFNSFADSSLEFFVYTFTKTVNWVEFHHVKEAVLLEIVRIIEGHDAEFAFPTRTLHMIEAELEPEGTAAT